MDSFKQLNHPLAKGSVITDDNYFIVSEISSVDNANRKNHSAVIVDSTREDDSDSGWKTVMRKGTNMKPLHLKKRYKKRKMKYSDVADESPDKIVGNE